MDTPPEKSPPRAPPLLRRRTAEQELIIEITSAAEQIAAARTAEEIWRATLLNGLGDHELRATTHVIRVVRQRLERNARELAQHKAHPPGKSV